MLKTAFKLCIFGDGGVGKTTLINRYVTGVFTESTIMTIGVGFNVKKIIIKENPVSLQIWDFAGEDRFRFLLPAYVKGARGGLFVFDTTRFVSLNSIDDWAEVIEECTDRDARPLPIILVGSKCDLTDEREISADYAKELCESFKFLEYIECSSKTGFNVEEIFFRLACEMVERKSMV